MHRTMNKLLIFTVSMWCHLGISQVHDDVFDSLKTVPGQRFRLYQYNGETYMYGSIDAVDIVRRPPTAQELRQGRRQLERFTKLQWMVHSVYPYAQRVAELLNEVEQDMANIQGSQAQKEYIKQREQELFARYEQDFRKMSRTQGKILIKLISRQTGITAYDLIRDTKNGASAFFWQGIGRIFGMNLKEGFNSTDDALIEAIVAELDRGGYNICYKSYNYRLQD